MKKTVAATVVLLLMLAGLCAYGWFAYSFSKTGPLPTDKLVHIAPGTSTKGIAAQLAQEGAIDTPFFFTLQAKIHAVAGALKAGEYMMTAGMSHRDIIALLQSGKTFQHQLTIAEGLTSAEIIELINAAPALEGKIETPPAEGALLPETYNYTYGENRADIIARMQKAMQNTVATLWAQHAEGLPISTPEQAVTLASIVEKETALPTERPRIAGVFVNRLKANMPLQSDPTVIYAVTVGKAKMDRPLSRRDLNMDSPYNTYVVTGLPPGPIANPGRESIAAAMNPEQNGYYYFVADGTGGHAFAATLEEHARNVAKWREIEKKSQ